MHHFDKKPFSHVAMDLFREVIGKLDTEENKLCASKQPVQIPPAADCLRVKEHSTVTLNVCKVPKKNRKNFEEDNRRNIQPGLIPDSSQYKEINLCPVVCLVN